MNDLSFSDVEFACWDDRFDVTSSTGARYFREKWERLAAHDLICYADSDKSAGHAMYDRIDEHHHDLLSPAIWNPLPVQGPAKSNLLSGLSRAGLFALTLLTPRLDATNLEPAWQALSHGFYQEAAELFRATEDTPASRLGASLSALNRGTTTVTALDEIHREWEALAITAGEPARAARYLLGRWYQLHPYTPDPLTAADQYRQLISSATDDLWHRLAVVKLAILHLTALPQPAGLNARLAEADALLRETTDPVTKRDLHLVIAEVRLHHRRHDAGTRDHLLAALNTAAPADLRADLLIQVARLSQLLKEPTVARSYYQRFVREHPLDRRCSMVGLILAGGETPGPAS